MAIVQQQFMLRIKRVFKIITAYNTTTKKDAMSEYKYLGDFSATPVWHTRHMECHDCKVSWGGCWDNFQCPKCGQGDLPSSDTDSLSLTKCKKKNKFL